MAASAIGTLGSIAGGFALAFLVFDETGSTLASALITAIQFLPYLLLPVLIAPFMDRLPRKSFLVAGDIANAVLLAGMGIWLLFFRFSYVGYLAVSLLLACLGAVDELAFTSIYPELIPEGAEQKGYAVSSMLYPVLKVIMTPLAAVLLDTLGVAWILSQPLSDLIVTLHIGQILPIAVGVAEKKLCLQHYPCSTVSACQVVGGLQTVHGGRIVACVIIFNTQRQESICIRHKTYCLVCPSLQDSLQCQVPCVHTGFKGGIQRRF